MSARCPHSAACEQVRHGVQTADLVITARRGELLHRDAHRSHLVDERRTRCLLFDDDAVWVPVTVLLDCGPFERRELHAVPERIQEDDVGLVDAVVVRLVEHTPRRAGTIVSALGLLEGRIPRLEDEIARRRAVVLPNTPPLALDDGALVPGRVLLVLRHPLGVGQFLFKGRKLFERPKLRPQRVARGQQSRKLDDFPLVPATLCCAF